ncbi:hypothetical protein BDZ90DRAFT_280206 [Jaminaea rosea]|uniref:Uncharacterized protein n=1 Tax=Jaminaea rosea TaxID=1569628 RepID=A0A316UN30_9BASI|nr:hypothetical protein BDZ90DRAFT_280206 [Jaminaea rosea]PWN26712.1 hypothetical protein BDZ90DRAFT_280206 [Jaminaea rosea]
MLAQYPLAEPITLSPQMPRSSSDSDNRYQHHLSYGGIFSAPSMSSKSSDSSSRSTSQSSTAPWTPSTPAIYQSQAPLLPALPVGDQPLQDNKGLADYYLQSLLLFQGNSAPNHLATPSASYSQIHHGSSSPYTAESQTMPNSPMPATPTTPFQPSYFAWPTLPDTPATQPQYIQQQEPYSSQSNHHYQQPQQQQSGVAGPSRLPKSYHQRATSDPVASPAPRPSRNAAYQTRVREQRHALHVVLTDAAVAFCRTEPRNAADLVASPSLLAGIQSAMDWQTQDGGSSAAVSEEQKMRYKQRERCAEVKNMYKLKMVCQRAVEWHRERGSSGGGIVRPQDEEAWQRLRNVFIASQKLWPLLLAAEKRLDSAVLGTKAVEDGSSILTECLGLVSPRAS